MVIGHDVAELLEQIAELTRERDALRVDLEAADALRQELRALAVEASGVTVAAITRVERAEPVIVAAYALCKAVSAGVSSAVGSHLATDLIRAVIVHRDGAPS